MLLAAGAGKRLRPLTTYFAKPSLPILGRPMLDFAWKRLVRQGIEEIVVNLHHRPETLAASLEVASAELTVHRSLETELLGTAGGLKRVERFFVDETFLLVNGDTLAEFDISRLVKVHRARKAKATILLRRRPGGTSYSGVSLDSEGRVLGIERRDPRAEHMFAGVWLLEPSVFEYLSGNPAGLEDELLEPLIAEGALAGVVSEGAWVTIDTPRRYWEASLAMARDGWFEEDWAVRRRPFELVNGARTEVLAGPDTRVEEGVRFSGIVVLGASCHVKRGARLENVVCWDSVSIGAGASLVNAVVTRGVAIPSAAELQDKVILRLGADRSNLRRREIKDDLVIAELKSGRVASL
jgi:NDP-sugar pyrophosphorylase family protein